MNTTLLAGMDASGLRTAHGGLLRLLQEAGKVAAAPFGLGGWWHHVMIPATSGTSLQFGFHVLVGLLMALAYAWAVEPVLTSPSWVRGLAYAAAAWLLNSAIVLPLIGEGFAGSRHLALSGMIGFAVAHTFFFVLLAIAYGSQSETRRHRWVVSQVVV